MNAIFRNKQNMKTKYHWIFRPKAIKVFFTNKPLCRTHSCEFLYSEEFYYPTLIPFLFYTEEIY
jgi:hypothetical protein